MSAPLDPWELCHQYLGVTVSRTARCDHDFAVGDICFAAVRHLYQNLCNTKGLLKHVNLLICASVQARTSRLMRHVKLDRYTGTRVPRLMMATLRYNIFYISVDLWLTRETGRLPWRSAHRSREVFRQCPLRRLPLQKRLQQCHAEGAATCGEISFYCS